MRRVFLMVVILMLGGASVSALTISPKIGVVSSDMGKIYYTVPDTNTWPYNEGGAEVNLIGTGIQLGCELGLALEDNLNVAGELNLISHTFYYGPTYQMTTYYAGLKGIYKFLSTSNVIPFVGAGLVFTQSSTGNAPGVIALGLGYQLLLGIEYKDYFAQIKYYLHSFGVKDKDLYGTIPISNVAFEFGYNFKI